MKACKECGSLLFEDMDICYVCMSDTANNALEPESPVARAVDFLGLSTQMVKRIEASTKAASNIGSSYRAQKHLGAHARCDEAQSNDSEDCSDNEVSVCFRIGGIKKPQSELDISEGHFVNIGRALTNDIVIPDLSVSRKHARLILSEGDIWLEDLASKNHSCIEENQVGMVKLENKKVKVRMGLVNLELEILPKSNVLTAQGAPNI